jgi:hypothetical protein
MTATRHPTLPTQVSSLGGCAVLLHKPFSRRQLFAAVDRCLDRA